LIGFSGCTARTRFLHHPFDFTPKPDKCFALQCSSLRVYLHFRLNSDSLID
jgi:hypothetical protein